MSTTAGLSVEAYLRTSFPGLDKEYRDGELIERGMPDYPHGSTQGLLAAFFVNARKRHRLYVASETRLRVGPRVFLIPDVSVFHPDPPKLNVPDEPPFVAIEILSPDDRLKAVHEKLKEYRVWGVRHVWLVDPHGKRMYTYDAELVETPTLRIPELNLEIQPTDIFD